jgi:hypothetical protein
MQGTHGVTHAAQLRGGAAGVALRTRSSRARAAPQHRAQRAPRAQARKAPDAPPRDKAYVFGARAPRALPAAGVRAWRRQALTWRSFTRCAAARSRSTNDVSLALTTASRFE